ncbi:MAG: DNA polymerase III subunit beta [Lachnospiraceae bacterium]|nr:DNA polymerase III subunit beta [Lachnospiraceae bacterium]
MKIVCQKDVLLKGVNIALRAIPSKTTMPIMECILISCSNNQITLTANDGELAINTAVDGEIINPGTVAIEAKILSDIVRKLPDSDVTIDVDDNFLVTITCEKAKFEISGSDGYDFTGLPQVNRSKYISISQFNLKEIIRQTIFSISDSDNNHIMGGELFEVKGNILRMASLDGHRISIRRLELKDNYEDSKVIIPGKTLGEISKILSGGVDDEVIIYITKNHIMFEFDTTIIVSRLIEGEYFKIDNMISGDYETKVDINKKDLLSCIDRSTLLIKENDKKPLIMNITDDNMELKLISAIGSLREDISVNKTGKDIMIGFNPMFLMDALRVIDDENVSIYMVNAKAPCFIKDDSESYIYLILPVNFNIN